jgi:hypothetical protein
VLACRYDYCYRDDYEHNYGWCYTVRSLSACVHSMPDARSQVSCTASVSQPEHVPAVISDLRLDVRLILLLGRMIR